jgi:hypothetical protein
MESGRGLSPAVDNQATPGLSTAANRAAKTLRPEGMESRASMNQLNDRGKGFEVLKVETPAALERLRRIVIPVRERIAGVARPHPGDMIENSDWSRRKADDHGSQRIAPHLRV